MKKYLFVLSVIGVILVASTAFAVVVDYTYYTLELSPNVIYKGKDYAAESLVGEELIGIFRPKPGVVVGNITASISAPWGVVTPGLTITPTSAIVSYTPPRAGTYRLVIAGTLIVGGQSYSAWEDFSVDVSNVSASGGDGGGGGCNAGLGIGALLLVSALWTVTTKKQN